MSIRAARICIVALAVISVCFWFVAPSRAMAIVTVQVSTLLDEDDCPSCTLAQLNALRESDTSPPGGGTGISFREALSAINVDFAVNGKTNQGIGFDGLVDASGDNASDDQRSECGTGQFYWTVAFGSPIQSIRVPGMEIDGTAVDAGATTGANNTLGPKVLLDFGGNQGFVVDASATGTILRGLAIVGATGNAISVASTNTQILGNNIGLGCDTVQATGNVGDGIQLAVGSRNNTISNNFIGASSGGDGIEINGDAFATPQANTIHDNRIGIDENGAAAGNDGAGILIQNGGNGNAITNNTISGNDVGVAIQGSATTNTTVVGNFIGTDSTGVVDVGNLTDGIQIGTVTGSPRFNTIRQNVISGNGGSGVVIDSRDPADIRAQQNVVAANKIGVDATGDVRLQNDANGVVIAGDTGGTANAGSSNIIGGASAGDGNQISGNGMFGVVVRGTANNNRVQFNLIGPDTAGADGGAPAGGSPSNGVSVSNLAGGVLFADAAQANDVLQNVIAFNDVTGVAFSGEQDAMSRQFNRISQNAIVANPAEVPRPNPGISGIVTPMQQGLANDMIHAPPPTPTDLLKIDAAVLVANGALTVEGTFDFADNPDVNAANPQNVTIEVFIGLAGSETDPSQSEGQLFLGSVTGPFEPNPGTNGFKWTLNTVVNDARFLDPAQPPYITSTITTLEGSTSPLSLGAVPASPPTPTPTHTLVPTPTPTPTSSPTPTNTVMPLSTSTPTSTPTLTNTATPTPTARLVHIGDLEGGANRGLLSWRGVVTVTVHDGFHGAVEGARVAGMWSAGNAAASSCTTGKKGRCDMTSGAISNSRNSVTFSVTNVLSTSGLYSATLNHDPDGDSSGSAIQILR
jgi:hypothetical protein